MVKLKVGDQMIDFMVGTGAEMSAVSKPVALLPDGHCCRRNNWGKADQTIPSTPEMPARGLAWK